MGLIYPSSGSASLFDFPVGSLQALEHVGYLPDQPNFYDDLTADESLAFCAELGGVPRRQIRARVDALLGLAGLTDARHRRLRNFSKGMLQRMGIAQALIHNPPLLILDEPMSGLDPIGRMDVRKLLFKLKHEGKTIVFSSHLLQDVETLCDRVGILVRGRMTKMGRLSDLIGACSISRPDYTAASTVEAIDDLFSDRKPTEKSCTA
jgi:ABC-2 type transport system ATP-binding protein